MNRLPCNLTQACVALLFAMMLISLLGCNQDPAGTVTLEISGISAESDRDDVKKALKGMTDQASYNSYSSYSDGKKMTVNLSPVSDVDAFVKKVNFGTVTEVSGRTIKIDFVP